MFDKIASLADDADKLFEELARQLVDAGKFHELFDARLAQSRHRLALPIDKAANLDDLPEPIRTNVEQAYLSACREVGQLLLEQGRFQEGWMYLRPAGEKTLVRASLERAVPDENSIEELIQVALHEGVAVERGLGWMLGHYGTCNSITTFEGIAGSLDLDDQRACAAVLVHHLHNELLANVRAHIERVEDRPPEETSLTAMIADRGWLFDNDSYHVDTSHLGAVVRFSRLLEDPATLEVAIELTEYGRCLDRKLQYPGDPPFTDPYTSHRLLFLATLGRDVEAALAFFDQQAKDTSVEEFGSGAIETYLILLDRTHQYRKALAAYNDLVSTTTSLSPFAPTALTLARKSGDWDLYLEIMQNRGDLVGYAMGHVQQLQEQAS